MKITPTTDVELLAHLNKPVHDLHVSLYPEYFVEYNFEAIRDSFKQCVTNENFIFLVLEDNEQPLGYAWIEIKDYPENAFRKQRKSIFVHNISIVEGQKRQGYGSHLMNHIYDLARRKGISLIELDYWANNEHAKNFHNKQGFLNYREMVFKQL